MVDQRTRRQPPRPRRRVGRAVALVLVLFLVALVGGWFYVDSTLNRTAALVDYGGRPAAGKGVNWLVVGSDSRDGLSEEDKESLATGNAAGGRTDTMMLLHVPDSGKPTLLSLPRDSYLPIQGHGKNKLNASFAWGGAPLLIRTVEESTGLRVDHYAEVGFPGFVSVVDAVGGVDMCIDKPMNDDKAGIDLAAGCQKLNGTQALGYVRTRAFARADLERIEHQRKFLSALMDKVTSFGVLANPFRGIPVTLDGARALTVDDGDHLHNLVGLAFALRGAASGELVTATVPVGSTPTINGASVVLWDKTRAPQLFEALKQDQPAPAGTVAGG